MSWISTRFWNRLREEFDDVLGFTTWEREREKDGRTKNTKTSRDVESQLTQSGLHLWPKSTAFTHSHLRWGKKWIRVKKNLCKLRWKRLIGHNLFSHHVEPTGWPNLWIFIWCQTFLVPIYYLPPLLNIIHVSLLNVTFFTFNLSILYMMGGKTTQGIHV